MSRSILRLLAAVLTAISISGTAASVAGAGNELTVSNPRAIAEPVAAEQAAGIPRAKPVIAEPQRGKGIPASVSQRPVPVRPTIAVPAVPRSPSLPSTLANRGRYSGYSTHDCGGGVGSQTGEGAQCCITAPGEEHTCRVFIAMCLDAGWVPSGGATAASCKPPKDG